MPRTKILWDVNHQVCAVCQFIRFSLGAYFKTPWYRGAILQFEVPFELCIWRTLFAFYSIFTTALCTEIQYQDAAHSWCWWLLKLIPCIVYFLKICAPVLATEWALDLHWFLCQTLVRRTLRLQSCCSKFAASHNLGLSVYTQYLCFKLFFMVYPHCNAMRLFHREVFEEWEPSNRSWAILC